MARFNPITQSATVATAPPPAAPRRKPVKPAKPTAPPAKLGVLATATSIPTAMFGHLAQSDGDLVKAAFLAWLAPVASEYRDWRAAWSVFLAAGQNTSHAKRNATAASHAASVTAANENTSHAKCETPRAVDPVRGERLSAAIALLQSLSLPSVTPSGPATPPPPPGAGDGDDEPQPQGPSTLAALVNRAYPRRKAYGDRYQNGVKPGPQKLAQFRECLRLQKTPAMRSQESVEDAIAHVKLFDPCGSWTWYITEWDGESEAFGRVDGHEKELGYIPLEEIANVRGRMGIGIELDMHWTPRPLSECGKD